MKENFLQELRKRLSSSFEIFIDENNERNIHSWGPGRFEVAAYKPGYSFLKRGLRDYCPFKEDSSLMSGAWLYNRKDSFLLNKKDSYLMVRQIEGFNTLDACGSQINDLENIRSFRNCRFEPVIGYLMNDDPSEYDLMIHPYSKGIELLSLSPRAPPKLLEKMSDVTANALAELHSNNIIYSETVPTNMRYDFSSKLILNPHNHILFDPKDKSEKIKDLALFIKTNSWLPDKNKFLLEYGNYMNYSMEDIITLQSQTFNWIENISEDNGSDFLDRPISSNWFYNGY